MKVAFSTLGCRVNLYESEAMAEKFKKEGYNVVEFDEVADVYVINTCTVTNMGDKKSRQMIRRAKRQNPEAIVAVVGCYSQIAPYEVSKIEGVNVVLGTRNKGDIVYWVNKAREEHKPMVVVKEVLKNNNFEELKIESFEDKTRAFLKIQDGCNRFCSYCLIPFARGAVCSKDPGKIEQEVNELANHGFKEIILSGIHIASYGVDFNKELNVSLIDIIEKIEDIDGIERVRIGSIEPMFFTGDIIERISKLKKLCPHFHLSLQSGCNDTLKRMNRRYTTQEYEDVVNKLRKNIKDVSITTDIIVGFPGETEEEFNETYDFLSRIKLSKMHVFKYSPREGTRAATMPNQLDGNIKDERSRKIIELDEIHEKEFINKFSGQNMNVLFEQTYNDYNNMFEGYTPNYIKVVVKSEKDLTGKIVKTKLGKFNNMICLGEI